MAPLTILRLLELLPDCVVQQIEDLFLIGHGHCALGPHDRCVEPFLQLLVVGQSLKQLKTPYPANTPIAQEVMIACKTSLALWDLPLSAAVSAST